MREASRLALVVMPPMIPRCSGLVLMLLEAMYRLCTTESLKGSINAAFDGEGMATRGTAATGKELTEKLLRQCVAFRSAVEESGSPVDAKLALKLRQAAHACLTSVVMATQRQEKLFTHFLLKGSELWHRIVDCQVVHQLATETTFEDTSQQSILLRSEWEGPSVRLGSHSSRQRGPKALRSGVEAVKYMSSQYLKDSHVNQAFHGSAIVTPSSWEALEPSDSPPPPLQQGENGGLTAAAEKGVATDDGVDDIIPLSSLVEAPQLRRRRIGASFEEEMLIARGGGAGHASQAQRDDKPIGSPPPIVLGRLTQGTALAETNSASIRC